MRQAIDDRKELKELLRYLMVSHRGLDPSHCSECGKHCKAVVHHPKYDGATLYDLAFVCQKCNTQPHNRNLA